MKIIIHCGSDKIGGNCVEIRSSNGRILIDFGMPLNLEQYGIKDTQELNKLSLDELKAKSLLPDVSGLYQGDNPDFDAILLSHAHQDHSGFLRYVHPRIPVYMSFGTETIIKVSNIFLPFKIGKINSQIISPNKSFMIKDIKVMPFQVDHSAYDALAFLIEANNQRLFYTGDFRSHGRKKEMAKKFLMSAPKNINCLVMEGTSMGRNEEICQDEAAIESRITKILNTNEGVSFFMTSPQNVDRLVSGFRACRQTKSIFIIDLYTAYLLDKLSATRKTLPRHSLSEVKVAFLKGQEKKIKAIGEDAFLEECAKKRIGMKEIKTRKDHILFLTRDNVIFRKFIEKYSELQGSTVIYSMWEGYLEKNDLREFCGKHKLQFEVVHTSGHAALEDLKKFAKALAPKVLIPIHTQHPKEYKKFFENVLELQDNEPFDLGEI